jgi:hypothetical protein
VHPAHRRSLGEGNLVGVAGDGGDAPNPLHRAIGQRLAEVTGHPPR